MSAANSTAFPAYGQSYRARVGIFDATTGLLIQSGLTGLVAKVSKDDAAQASASGTPTESGIPGIVYLDLTAAEMAANGVVVYITATNANAFSQPLEIAPLVLSQFVGTWDAQTILRFEQVSTDICTYLYGYQNTQGGSQTIRNANGTTKASGVIASTQQGTIKNTLVGTP